MSEQEAQAAIRPPFPTDWLGRGFLAAMILACAVALSPNTVDPDLWGHVQYAEDALADGRLHTTATHTFTADGHRWINHENLSELALAFACRAVGPQGMLLLKCLLGLAVMGLMIRSAWKRGVSMLVVCGLLLLVATTLTAFWAMRPQLASFVLLALLVVVLDRAFADWQAGGKVDVRWLWFAPPLFLVWTNSHGAFVAGFCLFVAYLGLRSLEALRQQGRQAWPMVLQFSAIVVVSALATLANPYGTDLHLWLADSLRHPRPEISEWAPPRPGDPFFLPMVLLMGVTVAAWCFSEKRRDWTQGILIALCMWQAVSHSRHIALFAILAGFWMPIHVDSLLARLRRGAPQGSGDLQGPSKAGRMIAAGLCFALLLLVGKLGMRLGDFPVEKDSYPVEAVQFMADHRFEGRLVVSFNWAQYAMAALQPDVTVAFDGRFRTCYPQKVIDMHFDFLVGDVPGQRYRSAASGPIDSHRVLNFKSPDLVLLDRRFQHSAKVMQEQQDFVLLYQDSLAQVWGRRERYDEPTSADYFAEAERRISERPQAGSVTWPALPVRRTAGRLAMDAGSNLEQPPASAGG